MAAVRCRQRSFQQRGKLVGMSQNLSDMHKLLRITEAELEQIESRLYSTVDAAEPAQLVERAVDLTTRVL